MKAILSALFASITIFASPLYAATQQNLDTLLQGQAKITEGVNNLNYYYEFRDNVIINEFIFSMSYSGIEPPASKEKWSVSIYSSDINNPYVFNLEPTPNGGKQVSELIFSPTSSLLKDYYTKFITDGYFYMSFIENTVPSNNFMINSATLNVKSSPVPVPGAALLLGSGLLGMVALRKRNTV